MNVSKHVLIMDDDPISVEVLKSYFEGKGAKNFVVATDGKQAIGYVDKLQDEIGLITCDLNMPDCDGIEFMQLLKDRQSKAAIVIVTSAADFVAKSANLLANAHGLNYLGLIKKPIQPKELDTAIAAIKPDGG